MYLKCGHIDECREYLGKNTNLMKKYLIWWKEALMKIIKKRKCEYFEHFYKKTKQHTETVIRSKNWWEKEKGKAKNSMDGQYQGLVNLKL